MRTILVAIGSLMVTFAQTAGQPSNLTPEQEEHVKKREPLIQELERLDETGKYREAIALLEKILQSNRDVFGENHEDVLGNIEWLAELREMIEDFATAKKTWESLIALKEKAFGKDHWETTNARLSLRNCELVTGLNPEQRSRLAKAKKDLSQIGGLREIGKYTEAVLIAEGVVRIRKEILGSKHISYGISLSVLAELFYDQHQYARAERYYKDAVKVCKAVVGEKHPDYATCLSNLARVHASQALFANAEPFCLEAMKIRKEVLGEKHGDYVKSLSLLANLYESQGLYAKAEPLYLQALAIHKEISGENHSKYADRLMDLAGLYCALGKYAESEKAFLKALKIIENQKEGWKSSQYSRCLNNLGLLYKMQGQYDKATPLLIKAFKICEEVYGKEHPNYAVSLNHLASLYLWAEQYEKAEQSYVEAALIMAKTKGQRHPDMAWALNNLSCVYFQQKQYTKAKTQIDKAIDIITSHLFICATFQEESEQIQHAALFRKCLDNYLVLPEVDHVALYDWVYIWHGAVAARSMFARLAANTSPENLVLVQQLRDVTRKINTLTQNPPAFSPKVELAKQVKALNEERESLQKNIAKQSTGFADYFTHLKQTPADLHKALPEGTALIDFFVHGDSISAFIVTKASIHRVVLQGGKELDGDLLTFLGELSLDRTRPVTHNGDVSVKLRKRLWEPLEEHLNGITRILICPDGPLCRLPFAALPGSDPKKYLLEERSIIVVPVPQLLPGLLNAQANKESVPSLLAVGDVDFNGDPAAGEPVKPSPVALTRGGGLSWSMLPQTKGEVEVIGMLFGQRPKATVKAITGKDATEAALEREMSKHRYLHFATHGFFAPPKFVRQFKDGTEGVAVPVLPPGLSSGIVCAGANKPTFQSSGILTATQIAELDLRNVELVVLSACETGLGELTGGEGVLGLQRAFQIAGARSTVSSLWAIPDKSTAELMKRMYENHLSKGLPAAEALREAQLWVLNHGEEVGAFEGKPTGSKRTPPKFWAAFTFAGDWR